jgi:predicted esterase
MIVYPPRRNAHHSPQPVTLALHGICSRPEWDCPWWADATTPHGWLVCPQAPVACGGASSWSVGRTAPLAEAAVRSLAEARPGEVDLGDRTLVGFSLGATAALDVAEQGGWRKLLLLSADIHPGTDRLKRAGVERVVLASGNYDMMHTVMTSSAARFDREGLPAIFVSLGDVGHTYPQDLPERMTRAMDWLQGEEDKL